MEDYDVFLEMKDINEKQTIMFVESDKEFIINNLLNSKYECMPIRFSYDLREFDSKYIDLTKQLFIYYYDKRNTMENEYIKMKKHFVHYRRTPFICFLPLECSEYSNLYLILKKLNIEIISDMNLFIKKINNSKKLIFIDNDGTLRNDDGKISNRNKEIIEKIKMLGNYIVICTSRPRYQGHKIMLESNASSIIVTSNGAEIYDVESNEVIYANYMDNVTVLNYVKYAFQNDLRLIISTTDVDYVTKEVRNQSQLLLNKDDFYDVLSNLNIKQCMFIDRNNTKIKIAKNKVNNDQKIHIVDEISDLDSDLAEEKWFSFSDINTSKGNALSYLADYLYISHKNTIAIGNDENDISMFEQSGYSVAVANAADNVKNKAKFVTLSNNDDGVAIFLEKLL